MFGNFTPPGNHRIAMRAVGIFLRIGGAVSDDGNQSVVQAIVNRPIHDAKQGVVRIAVGTQTDVAKSGLGNIAHHLHIVAFHTFFELHPGDIESFA